MLLGERLQAIRLKSSFLLRSTHPPLEAVRNRRVQAVRRLGKRVVIELLHFPPLPYAALSSELAKLPSLGPLV